MHLNEVANLAGKDFVILFWDQILPSPLTTCKIHHNYVNIRSNIFVFI